MTRKYKPRGKGKRTIEIDKVVKANHEFFTITEMAEMLEDTDATVRASMRRLQVKAVTSAERTRNYIITMHSARIPFHVVVKRLGLGTHYVSKVYRELDLPIVTEFAEDVIEAAKGPKRSVADIMRSIQDPNLHFYDRNRDPYANWKVRDKGQYIPESNSNIEEE